MAPCDANQRRGTLPNLILNLFIDAVNDRPDLIFNLFLLLYKSLEFCLQSRKNNSRAYLIRVAHSLNCLAYATSISLVVIIAFVCHQFVSLRSVVNF